MHLALHNGKNGIEEAFGHRAFGELQHIQNYGTHQRYESLFCSFGGKCEVFSGDPTLGHLVIFINTKGLAVWGLQVSTSVWDR